MLYDLYSMLPLDTVFGVNRKHRCLFHNDHRPSAQISYTSKTKDCGEVRQYRYFCNSVNCDLSKRSGRKGHSLIDLVMFIGCVNKLTALKFLNEVFNIELPEQGWRQKKSESIDWFCNKTASPSFPLEYPHLHELLKHHGDKLRTLLRYVQANMPVSSLTGDDRLVFSIALRTMRRIMKQDHVNGAQNTNRLNQRLKSFCMHGLIEIADPDILPFDTVNHAKERSKQGPPEQPIGDKDYHTQFYVIPDYNEELLRQAEDIAKACRAYKVSRKQVNRDSCEKTFGTSVDQFYPQDKHSDVRTKADEQLMNNLQRAIEHNLDEHGFCSRTMAIDSLRGYKRDAKEQAYAKYVPGLMRDLDLTWGVVGKKMRTKYRFVGGNSGEHALVRRNAAISENSNNPAA